MKLPVLEGIIRRRILVNFRVDAKIMRAQLPAVFEPKLHNGSAIAGICLIRLEQIRPKRFPAFLGFSSENAAHRIAVTWRDANAHDREGVFIPRRDSGSRFNHFAGGKLFPGQHHLAHFHVRSDADAIDLKMKSNDGKVIVAVAPAFAIWPMRLPSSSPARLVTP